MGPLPADEWLQRHPSCRSGSPSSIPDQRPQRHCLQHLAGTISQAPSRHCSSGIREGANTRVSVRETVHTVPCCALPSGPGGALLPPGLNLPVAQAVQQMATAAPPDELYFLAVQGDAIPLMARGSVDNDRRPSHACSHLGERLPARIVATPVTAR